MPSNPPLTLRVELVVTDNRRHMVRARSRFLIDTDEYRAWKEQAFWSLKTQLPSKFIPYAPTYGDQLFYRIAVFLKDARSDAANYDKGIRDVITHAGVWTDDKWCLPIFDPVTIDRNAGVSYANILLPPYLSTPKTA